MHRPLTAALLFSFAMSVLAAGSAVAQDGKVDLKLNLAAGKTYRTRMVQDQKTTTTMMGQQMDIASKQTKDIAMAVSSVDGGLATIGITIERIASSMDSPQGSMSYDSAEQAETQNPQFKPLAAMVGSGYTVVADQHGEVKELRGIQEMLDRIFDSVEVPNEAMREGLKAQMSRMVGEGGSKAMMGQIFGMLPSGPVAVGESWTKTVEITSVVPMKADTRYTLKSVSGNTAVIEVHSEFDTGAGGEGMKMGPATVRMDLKGEQDGTVEVDLETGLVKGGSSVLKTSGTQSIQGGQGGMQNMEIPLNLEATITLQSL